MPIVGVRTERIPFVAIVGRPNAGKSTLFNRLAGSRLAIVDAAPGTTRDRVYAEIDLRGRPVGLIDTGGIEAPGGGADPMADRIRLQVRVAVEEADVVVCLFDAKALPGPDDAEVVDLLRRAARPVVHAANKVDGPRDVPGAVEYHALGVDDIVRLSTGGGGGVGDLVDAIVARLPPARLDETAEPEAEPDADQAAPVPRVAIIGRPNVGKSTLVNRLAGEDRVIVDERPGTTRDAVDTLIETERGPFVLIDTAGLRKRPKISSTIERLAALSAVRALERCHVAVLLVDGSEGGALEQDRHLAGLAAERGRALAIAVNKTDIVTGAAALRTLDGAVRDSFSFVPYAPVVFVSARSGRGVPALMEAVDRIHQASNRRIPTGELNSFIETVLTDHSPPLRHGKPVRFYYATQVGVRPPTFLFFTNRPDGVHRSYERYLENRLRERLDLAGCPVRIRFRRGRNDD